MLGADILLFLPLLLALGIPALVEWISKTNTPKWVRSTAVVALSLLLAVIPTVGVGALASGTLAGLGTYLLSALTAWLLSGRAYLAGMADKQLRERQGHVDLENPPTLDGGRV